MGSRRDVLRVPSDATIASQGAMTGLAAELTRLGRVFGLDASVGLRDLPKITDPVCLQGKDVSCVEQFFRPVF